MNRITESKIEIVPDTSGQSTGFSNAMWVVKVYLKWESGESAEVEAGRYTTPLEAGEAARNLESFYKFLTPSMKTGV